MRSNVWVKRAGDWGREALVMMGEERLEGWRFGAGDAGRGC